MAEGHLHMLDHVCEFTSAKPQTQDAGSAKTTKHKMEGVPIGQAAGTQGVPAQHPAQEAGCAKTSELTVSLGQDDGDDALATLTHWPFHQSCNQCHK
jgi:hypothetical protein